jgi:hypothetical protein
LLIGTTRQQSIANCTQTNAVNTTSKFVPSKKNNQEENNNYCHVLHRGCFPAHGKYPTGPFIGPSKLAFLEQSI